MLDETIEMNKLRLEYMFITSDFAYVYIIYQNSDVSDFGQLTI